jgi:hypothetical protein
MFDVGGHGASPDRLASTLDPANPNAYAGDDTMDVKVGPKW